MGAQLFGSLILTLIICFVLPAVGFGLALAALSLGAWLPWSGMSDLGKECLVDFLVTFGAGDMMHGVVIICMTVSIVGGLFEMFTFYKYLYLK